MLIQLSIHRYWTWHGHVHAWTFYVLNFFFPFGLKRNCWLSPISQKKCTWMVPSLVSLVSGQMQVCYLLTRMLGSMMIHHICNGISTEWNRAELVCHIWSLIMFYWWENTFPQVWWQFSCLFIYLLVPTWIQGGVVIK